MPATAMSSIIKAVAAHALSDYEREEAWKAWMRICVTAAETLYNAGDREGSRLITVQLDGDHCPRCRCEYERVEVDNLFAKGMYWRPICHCFAPPEPKMWVQCAAIIKPRADSPYRCRETMLVSKPGPEDSWKLPGGRTRYKAYFCGKCQARMRKTGGDDGEKF